MPGHAKAKQEEELASTKEVKDAIEKYARAVEHRLKPGLDAACKLRDKAFEQLAEVEQMKKTLDVLQLAAEENQKKEPEVDEAGRSRPPLETMVNIGEEFYMNAHVHQLDPIIVDVGLGVLVEMSREEARLYVEERKAALEAQAAKHTKRIAEVRAHLSSVMQYLSELQISSIGDDLMMRSLSAAEDL